MAHDLYSNIKPEQSIQADAYTAATHNGDIVDSLGYEEIMVIVDVGDMGTGATLDMKVQHDTDPAGGTMADLSGASLAQITKAGGGDNETYCFQVPKGHNRYLRVVGVLGTEACDFSAVILLGAPSHAPVTQATPA